MSRSSHCSILLDATLSLRNPRVLMLLLGLGAVWQVFQHPEIIVPAAFAQEDDPASEEDEPSVAPEPARSSERRSEDAPGPKQWTWFDTFKAGGTIGAIIILMSFAAVGLVVEHSLSLRKARIMPENVVHDLESLIGQGRIQEAVDYCNDPRNSSLTTDVVLAGLERFQTSEFGSVEYKNACEEAGEEGTAKLYRKIDFLNLIGVIAPMLGLLGTVQGMIEAFSQLASTEGAAKPWELAGGISKALVTTFEGLVVAIPAMVAYSLFRSQIDHLVAEAGKRVEHITAPLSRRSTRPAAPVFRT